MLSTVAIPKLLRARRRRYTALFVDEVEVSEETSLLERHSIPAGLAHFDAANESCDETMTMVQ